ncbi:unnamed protein product [Arctia plantaginis]|uniref:C2H2-type domain-containing protein n=1 Tax=Arctia plantaginis TaxID=874455 RepID=A0A8S1B5N8_ARCPL|nr:unnamed protein product [Arctia plantaginis]
MKLLSSLLQKTQSSNPGRWRGRDPDRKIAFKQMFKLKNKIESRSSITWSRRAPEHNMALREIKNLQKEAQSSSIEGGGALKTKREQCYICLKKFLDKDAFRIHFSHVHLRKIYKCTVEGCLRIFSSEPLRNRHSYIHHK